MLKRLFSVMALVLSFAGAPAAAQVFDFSLTFTGNTNLGGDGSGSLSGLITFDDTGAATNFTNVRLFAGGENVTNRESFELETFSASLGGGAAGNTLSNFNFEANWEGVSFFKASYPEQDFGTTGRPISFAVTSVTPGQSQTTYFVEYTLGEETVITTSGETVSGNAPVSVPEINGGTIPLLAFILSVVAMMLYMRNTSVTRKSGFNEYKTPPAHLT